MCYQRGAQDCDSYASLKSDLCSELTAAFSRVNRTNTRLSQELCETTWAHKLEALEQSMKDVSCTSVNIAVDYRYFDVLLWSGRCWQNSSIQEP